MVVVELSLPSAFSVLDQWCRWYSGMCVWVGGWFGWGLGVGGVIVDTSVVV